MTLVLIIGGYFGYVVAATPGAMFAVGLIACCCAIEGLLGHAIATVVRRRDEARDRKAACARLPQTLEAILNNPDRSRS